MKKLLIFALTILIVINSLSAAILAAEADTTGKTNYALTGEVIARPNCYTSNPVALLNDGAKYNDAYVGGNSTAEGKNPGFTMDLGEEKYIDTVCVYHRSGYGMTYTVSVSNDKSTWSDVGTTSASETVSVEYTTDSGTESKNTSHTALQFTEVKVRYVKLTGTAAEKHRAMEIEVWGTTRVSLGKLDSPTLNAWEGSVLSWNAVDNAESYSAALYLNGDLQEEYPTTDTSIDLGSYMTEVGEYTVKVTALTTNEQWETSDPSAESAAYVVSAPVQKVNVALGITDITFSRYYGTASENKAILTNGVYSGEGYCGSNGTAGDHVVTMNLGAEKAIDEIRIYSVSGGAEPFYNISVSLDGTNYTPVGTTGEYVNSCTSLVFTPVKAQYIKITAAEQGIKNRLTEIEVLQADVENYGKIDTPVLNAWEGKIISWGAVTNATAYRVEIYLDGDLRSTRTVAENSVDLKKYMILPGAYTVKVAAITTHVQWDSGDFSQESEPYTLSDVNLAEKKNIFGSTWYDYDDSRIENANDGDFTTTAVANYRYSDYITVDLYDYYVVKEVWLYAKKGGALYNVYTSIDNSNYKANHIGDIAKTDTESVNSASFNIYTGTMNADNITRFVTFAASETGYGSNVTEIVIKGEKLPMYGKLPTPAAPVWTDTVLSWNGDEHATSYLINFFANGEKAETFSTEATSIDMAPYLSGLGSYTATVTARTTNIQYENSLESVQSEPYVIDSAYLSEDNITVTSSLADTGGQNHLLGFVVDNNMDTAYTVSVQRPYSMLLALDNKVKIENITLHQPEGAANIESLTVEISTDSVTYSTVYEGAPAQSLSIDLNKDATHIRISVNEVNAVPSGFSEIRILASLTDGAGGNEEGLSSLNINSLIGSGYSLPLTDANSNVISWTSSNPAVINVTGGVTVINPQASDADVTLTAAVTVDGVTYRRYFTVTVEKNTPAPADPVPSGGGGGGGGGASYDKVTVKTEQTPEDENTENEDKSLYTEEISGHWAENEIKYLLDEGIVKGNGSSLALESKITRAELAAMIDRIITVTEKADELPFTDVKENMWYTDILKRMYAANIMVGSEGLVRPDENITREDTAKVLANVIDYVKLEAEGSIEAQYADTAQISSYAKESVMHLSSLGILNGFENGNFMPKNHLTRAQSMAVVYRLLSLIREV